MGALRIDMPIASGHLVVRPLLTRIREVHRQQKLEVRLQDAHADLARDGTDLAIRTGELPGGRRRGAQYLRGGVHGTDNASARLDWVIVERVRRADEAAASWTSKLGTKGPPILDRGEMPWEASGIATMCR